MFSSSVHVKADVQGCMVTADSRQIDLLESKAENGGNLTYIRSLTFLFLSSLLLCLTCGLLI